MSPTTRTGRLNTAWLHGVMVSVTRVNIMLLQGIAFGLSGLGKDFEQRAACPIT
jgi:hypothetical protein